MPYRALQSKTPLEEIPTLTNYISEYLTDSKQQLPSKSTIARGADEVSVLSYIQATKILIENDVATLGWDATSLDEHHVNSVYVSLPGPPSPPGTPPTPRKYFNLSVAALPGGKAIDYLTHITSTIDLMSQIYGGYVEENPISIKQNIIDRITSSVSDRVNTNSCMVKQLEALWEKDILDLKCNLHPLDGFASAVRAALKVLDTNFGIKTSGFDCAAANFIYSLSTLRYLCVVYFLSVC